MFAYPAGLEGIREATIGLVIVLVPAVLMVSKIKYRSFSAITPGRRHSYLTLLGIATVIAAIAIHPQVVLVIMAYGYLASGLTGLVLVKLRRLHSEKENLSVGLRSQRDRSVS